MAIDYRQIYQEFEKVRLLREYSEYVSELGKIDKILRSIPFDSIRAHQVCFNLANKYKTEINQLPSEMGVKRTVIMVQDPPQKTALDLVNDLQFFQIQIPVFALKRELKSEIIKALLGL